MRQLCMPQGLSNDELSKLETLICSARSVHRGEALYRSGDRFDNIYAVRSGSMKTVMAHRDAGVLSKLMVTPTPRTALVTGKVFAAGVRAFAQAIAVIVLSLLLGVDFLLAPWRLAGVAVTVMLGAAFFSALSMTLAGLVLTRDRLMGIGQAITMPLFFASNALYPIALMPPWVQAVSKVSRVAACSWRAAAKRTSTSSSGPRRARTRAARARAHGWPFASARS